MQDSAKIGQGPMGFVEWIGFAFALVGIAALGIVLSWPVPSADKQLANMDLLLAEQANTGERATALGQYRHRATSSANQTALSAIQSIEAGIAYTAREWLGEAALPDPQLTVSRMCSSSSATDCVQSVAPMFSLGRWIARLHEACTRDPGPSFWTLQIEMADKMRQAIVASPLHAEEVDHALTSQTPRSPEEMNRESLCAWQAAIMQPTER